MVSSQPGTMSLTVTICTGIDRMQKTIEVPMNKTSGHEGDREKGESPCAFTALGHATVGGADGFMLAILLAFILALGVRGDASPPISRRAYLRPPPRGPPLTA
jgi:hypothetical protein